jgi:two-component system LytT family response regulator
LSDTYLEHFFVRSGRVSDLIKIENIDWIEAQDYYVKIHTCDKHYLVRTSLADFEKQLPPSKFVRIHRSYLVNLDSLTSIKQKEQGKYEAVVNNVSLEISRSGLSRLKQEAQVFS